MTTSLHLPVTDLEHVRHEIDLQRRVEADIQYAYQRRKLSKLKRQIT